MAVHHRKAKQSPLADLFPDWDDRRDLVWLWWQLKDEMGLRTDAYTDPDTSTRMAEYLRSLSIRAETLVGLRQRDMLPESKLPRVANNPRAIQWMTNELHKIGPLRAFELPKVLQPWQVLVALIDIEPHQEEKLRILQGLESAWAERQLDDRHFRWFKLSNERSRCEAAWNWYAENGHLATSTTPITAALPLLPAQRFEGYDDLASFWDRSDWRLDERLHHQTQIQRYLKNQLTKKNQAGKKQTNFLLSTNAKAALDLLALNWGVTKKEVIERLLLEAAKRSATNEAH